MIQKLNNVVQVSLFLILTFVLYFLFVLTIPIFQDSHGLLAVNELADISRRGFLKELIFGSALVCALLGTVMLSWVPLLAPGVIASLWSTTYFFIWIDTVFALSVQAQSLTFIWTLAVGMIFLNLYFYFLGFLAPMEISGYKPGLWKSKFLVYWFCVWMSFYFGLSILMALNSFEYPGFRLPLAFGAVALCFLNYLLYLYLKKSEGGNVENISRWGRFVFTLWLICLVAIGIGQKWIG